MGLIEISLIGVGLAMDAVAVAISNAMVFQPLRKIDYIAMILAFSVFQGLMPFLGYSAGSVFAEWITKYSGIVIFLILGVIGGNMIRESFEHESGKGYDEKRLTAGILFFQAVATSIDAFAVGVGFCAARVLILPAAALISAITAALVFAAVSAGKKCGNLFGNKAGMLGGVILIMIGIKGLL